MFLTIETLKRKIIEVILENNLTNLKNNENNVRKQLDFLENIYKGTINVDNSLRKLSKQAQNAKNEQQLKKIGDSLQVLRLPQIEKGESYENLLSNGIISVGRDVEDEFRQQVEKIYSIIQTKQDEFNRESGQGSLFETKEPITTLIFCKITPKGKKHYNKLKKRHQELLKMIEDESQQSLFEENGRQRR